MVRPSAARRSRRVMALFVVLSLLAAACGDDDGADGRGSGPDDTAPGPVDSEPEEDLGDPVPGGKLVYGIEADTATPWTPQNSVCAISCHMVMRAVYDPLTLANEDGEYEGNLLESIEPDADFTEWTLTPRTGIKFHDGTTFDAAAIKTNLDAHLGSFLSGKALLQVESVSVVGDAAVVKMKSPWSRFPAFMSGQLGYMASPTWLAEVATDQTLALEPVGTGPFVFKSYEPGGSFIATRNAEYWRADEGLPYLDQIEYRVLADGQTRKNALLNGDIDIMHTSNGELIRELRDQDAIELSETSAYGETSYTLMNNGNPESHLSDVRIRRALAMSVDQEEVNERRNGGVSQIANGPFSPAQVGYLEDTGYPAFDVDGARALIEEYAQEKGLDEVEVSYTTTNDALNLQTAELLEQFWEQAGFKVNITQVEQGQFIIAALLGSFEMFAWRNHGGIDPDSQRVWWHSETADPIDGKSLGLNFGRISDEVIDENLDIIRSSDDDAERTAAAEAINERFGEQVYNLWSTWTVWGIAKSPRVNGLDQFVLPSGTPEIYGNGIGGAHQVAQVWLEK